MGKLYDKRDLYALKPNYIKNFKQRLYYPRDLNYNVLFYIWDDGQHMQYKTFDTFFWKHTTVDNFLNMVEGRQDVGINALKFYIVQWQGYNTDKLTKPKELRGVKMDVSIKTFERNIQLFRKEYEDAVWIKDLGYQSYCVSVKDVKTGDTISKDYMNTQAWLKLENIFSILKGDTHVLDIVQYIVEKERTIKEGFHNKRYTGEDYSVAERKWESILNTIIRTYS